ncbi:MAG: tripartite tricarboxylate transporter substrate binding protein [Pigmentiphaga sp.]|uniref:Bug family tripartite tricarboxylate transporter substrate binding protein n=1 Tax=Pigmentiphaga sp. TaxID=1977564 RepID=UPI0029BDC117|nr:tripartite tricarboxylate transporter substrate binding protein [Pigmentiphaga sp.]MDX3907125.1 tripartite tricarboxylate transporter substrate binding protein [Pigmentiphaga sp.]
MIHSVKKSLVLGVGVLALQFSVPASSEAFPDKPVRLILAYSTGSGPDIVSRLVGEHLAKKWKQQVIVENRPGGSGFIAIQAMLSAPADGYNLLVADGGHIAVNPHIHKNVPFDSTKDLTGVSLMFKTPFFIAASSSGPIASVARLIEEAKAKPGQLSYGTPFVGSPSHLGSALFEQLTGTSMLHAPFKETSQLFSSVATGQVTWALGTVATTRPFVESGKVKLLAVAAPARLAGFENIPTVGQAGGPKDFHVETWLGVIARKGTPAVVLERLSKDIGEVMAQEDVRKYLSDIGFEAVSNSPGEFDRLIAEDTRRYAELVKQAKIQPQ